MHNGAWEALLSHIPPDQQNKYMLVTASGTEIAIQSFLRVEKELVILKGRLSGSQEQGRVFFIPFNKIDYFGTSQVTKDSEFQEVFERFRFPDSAPILLKKTSGSNQGVAPAPPPPPPPPEEVTPTNGHSSAPAPRPQPGSGIRPAIRSEVLERFRSARGTPSSVNLPRPTQES